MPPELEQSMSASGSCEPTFSVVVASHNAAGTLAEAVDSALGQTLAPLEVVVCDDGSTDSTSQVLARFDERVKVVRQTNMGESSAKNCAVRASRGDFVVVLDADDVFLPRRLEALAWLAGERPDLDVLTTDAWVEADGQVMRQAYHPGWTFPVTDQRAAILSRNFVFGLAAVRRERWLEIGGFDQTISRTADWDFWMRLILRGCTVGLVDTPLARYRLTTGTLSSDRRRLVEARIETLARASRRLDLSAGERQVVEEALRRERLQLATRLARDSLETGQGSPRRHNARLATAPGASVRQRLGAVLAVLSPAAAMRVLRRRHDGTVEIGAGLRVRPPGPTD